MFTRIMTHNFGDRIFNELNGSECSNEIEIVLENNFAYKSNKIIFCACSPFLKSIFKDSPDISTIILPEELMHSMIK